MVATLTPTLIENPLRFGLRMRRTPDPCVLVLFGITGDLAHRKLLPALYNLSVERRLPGNFSIVGVARRPLSHDDFIQGIKESIEKYARNKPSQRPGVWDSFARGLSYVQTDFDNADGYKELASQLEKIDQERGTLGNRLYYLSTPPDAYPIIIQNLGGAGLANARLIASPNGNGST